MCFQRDDRRLLFSSYGRMDPCNGSSNLREWKRTPYFFHIPPQKLGKCWARKLLASTASHHSPFSHLSAPSSAWAGILTLLKTTVTLFDNFPLFGLHASSARVASCALPSLSLGLLSALHVGSDPLARSLWIFLLLEM